MFDDDPDLVVGAGDRLRGQFDLATATESGIEPFDRIGLQDQFSLEGDAGAEDGERYDDQR